MESHVTRRELIVLVSLLAALCPAQLQEVVIVEFVQTMYTVTESEGQVEVCVNLTRPENISDVTIRVNVYRYDSSVYIPPNSTLATPDQPTVFGDYKKAPMTDYEEQFSAFNRISDSVLNASRRSTCYNQSIYDDVQIELSEYAGLTLDVRDANTVTRVTERYSNAAILILDDDVAVVDLERTYYQVLEDVGEVEVCAIVYSPKIDCPIAFPFDVNVTTNDSSAESPTDYGTVSTMLRFGACETRSCVNLSIMNDVTLEPGETLHVNLERTTELDSRITLNSVDGEIDIIDDDVAVVDLERTYYQVLEDVGEVEVCAIVYSPKIDCPIAFPFDVNVTTNDSSAESPTDYGTVSTMLRFGACETRSCVNLSIMNDVTLEPGETLHVNLEKTTELDSRITLNSVDGEIDIIDDDVAVVDLERTYYQVLEDVGEVELCAIVYSPKIDCPIAFPFDVNVTTNDGSAESPTDYGTVSTMLRFGACETRSCVNLSIMNDVTLEPGETLHVNLERTTELDSRITLSSVDGEIDIIDDDVAVVGLERALYQISEDAGEVEVCAVVYSPNIECPIPFHFDVRLTTGDESSGSSMDFTSISTNFTFDACDSRRCTSVSIIGDTILLNQMINITLEGTADLDSRVILDPIDGVIQIVASCPNLMNPDNGTVIMTGIFVGDAANFTCEYGFELVGNATLTCDHDGQWSAPPPVCQIIVIVSFDPTSYTVTEGVDEFVVLTLARSRDISEVTLVTVTTVPGSATGGFDYGPTMTLVEFAPGRTVAVFSILILDNNTVEPTEMFSATMTTNQTYVMIEDDVATITILDNDASCRHLFDPDNGTVMMTGNSNRDTATFTCNPGYELVGAETLTCQDDEQWNAPPPVCQIIVIVSFDPTTYTVTEGVDEVAVLTLTRSRDISEITRVTVTTVSGSATGGFDYGPTMTTVEFTPGQTVAVLSVPILDNNTVEPTEMFSATVTTNQTYVMIADDLATITILDSDVSCRDLIEPTNGTVMITGNPEGDTATFTCNPGYELVGAETLTCQDDGQWSAPPPVCQIIVIVSFDPTSYTVTEGVDEFVVLTLARSRDISEVTFVTVTTVSGSASARFDYNAMVMMVAFAPGQTVAVLNVLILDNNTVEPTEMFSATMTTNQTYVMIADDLATITILDSDVAVSCRDPIEPTNGTVMITGNLEGDTAIFTCNPGFELVGTETLTCQDDGEWSAPPPVCQIIASCRDLIDPDNGTVMMTGNLEGYTATFTCSPGFELVGAETVTCQDDGQWSAPPPVCQIIDSDNTDDTSSFSFDFPYIVAIAVFVLAAIILIVGLIVCVNRRRRGAKDSYNIEQYFDGLGSVNGSRNILSQNHDLLANETVEMSLNLNAIPQSSFTHDDVIPTASTFSPRSSDSLPSSEVQSNYGKEDLEENGDP